MASLPVFNEINALEYGTLKIPNELLNKRFRIAQRIIDQHSHYFKKELAALDKKLHNVSGPILLCNIVDDLNKLSSRLTQICNDTERITADEEESSKELLQKSAALSEPEKWLSKPAAATPEVSLRLEMFKRLRLDRFLIEHLLRSGYFDTAEAMARCVGVDMHNVINVFRAAKKVEETLAKRNLSACLAWIADNRSKLRRLNSMFETEVFIQQCAELIRTGRRFDAVAYARSHFGNLPAKQWRQGNLLILFGLLGFGVNSLPRSNGAAYERLLGDERYNELLKMFRHVNERIFQLTTQSAFSACFHTGAAAYKTPYCRDDDGSRCIICSRLHKIAAGLPFAHYPHSKIFCPITGEMLNEENLPLVLPNGRVYGEKAIHSMSTKTDSGIKFRCPITGDVVDVNAIKRVYFL